MESTMRRYVTAMALAAIALGATALAPDTAAGATLSEQSVRTLLNTAVSYHYHADVRRKTAEGACYFDPQKPTTIRCSWRWSDPGANASRLRQRVERVALKRCRNAGGESCIELYRNGDLTYDGLPPDEAQRLAAVLESIPSYGSEATPLPDDATVRAGRFHERFEQMQDYWEDWRKKKKGNRNYAMCANEQGSGVRFAMQSVVKRLRHIRAMCILQCQAVAQWENTDGRCHTLFENGKFTSTAAQRAMQLQVEPASPEVRETFVGAWKGIDPRGVTLEAVIERVDADGSVAGIGCREYANGSLAWRTLDSATFENGDRITVMNGNVRTTLMMDAMREGAEEIVQTWPSGWQSRTSVQPMQPGGCAERFTALAGAGNIVERPPDDAPIVGAWSGKWKNGSISELVIESVADDKAFSGRYCEKWTSGVLQLWDIGVDRPFQGTLDKKGKKARLTIPWEGGNRNELEFRLKGTDKVTMKRKERADTNRQKVTTLKMTRGASEDGCLLRTTSLSSANGG